MFGPFRASPTPPLVDIHGRPGTTLLITAGMDGDEYAPIAAAYEAAEKFRDGDFNGRLIIVPIVNIAGFEAHMSANPIDGKFPKYCIPGHAWGTSTERLIYTLVQTYARHAGLWLDLHSGAQNEIAIDCAWNDITSVEDIDARGTACITALGIDAAIREPAYRGLKTLARYGCAYVLAESEDEGTHAAYIERTMQTLGMLPGTPASRHTRTFSKTRPLRTFEEMHALQDGEVVVWHTIPTHGECRGAIAYDEQTS